MTRKSGDLTKRERITASFYVYFIRWFCKVPLDKSAVICEIPAFLSNGTNQPGCQRAKQAVMHNGDCGLPSLRRPSETGVASEALPSQNSGGALRWRLEGALNLRKGSPEAPGVLWKKTCRPDSGAPERALRRIRWAPPVGRRSSPDRACGIGSSRRRSTGPPRDIF